MTLYEIDSQIMALSDPETGEITDFEALDALEMEWERKIENVACLYKNCVADAEAIRAKEIALADRRRALEKKSEQLKSYLAYALNGKKFQSAKCAVSFHKSTYVKVEDESAALDWLERSDLDEAITYQMPKLNKVALKRILVQGIGVPGVELVDNLSVGVK